MLHRVITLTLVALATAMLVVPLKPTADGEAARLPAALLEGRAVPSFPGKLRQGREVRRLSSLLDKGVMRANLKEYVGNWPDHWYDSANGAATADWMVRKIEAVVRSAGLEGTGRVTVSRWRHAFRMNSIVVTIPGRSARKVVVGAHYDSTGPDERVPTPAPGADDNGSGTVTILEALRVLLTSPAIAEGGQQEQTLEFHWYAGEEPGMLGSLDIWEEYADAGVPVAAMLNQDMTGYNPRGTPLGLVMDEGSVDPGLTRFMRMVIGKYTNKKCEETRLGRGASSDHAAAAYYGFPAAFVLETTADKYNPAIHSAGGDTIDRLSFDHMLEHARLTVGYAYELAMSKEI